MAGYIGERRGGNLNMHVFRRRKLYIDALIFSSAVMALAATAATRPGRISTPSIQRDTGTLILVGATKESIILGADSAVWSMHSERVTEHLPKILPVSRFAACMFTGAIRLQIHGDSLDIRQIATEWIDKNHDATVTVAYTEIVGLVGSAIDAYGNSHPFHMGDDTHSFTSVLCAGYENGHPVLLVTDFITAPGAKWQVLVKRGVFSPLPVGFFVPLGRDKISMELLTGKMSSKFLNKYRNLPTIQKFKSDREKHSLDQMGNSDLLELSCICLLATENVAASRFDKDAVQVGAPNSFALIDAKAGFHWTAAPVTCR